MVFDVKLIAIPLVRFIPGFGASSLDFTLICHKRR